MRTNVALSASGSKRSPSPWDFALTVTPWAHRSVRACGRAYGGRAPTTNCGGDELLGDLLELDVIGDEPYFGLIEPAGDVDRVVVEVPEDSAYAIINVYSLVAGGCEAAQFDPELTLLSADLATEIARNDDHNGSCPRLVSDALAAGLYVVEVRESVDSVAQRHEFPYELAVTVDWCGNGEWGPREECDDGNTESGDGCSSTCRVE